jgi:hypothetical protein
MPRGRYTVYTERNSHGCLWWLLVGWFVGPIRFLFTMLSTLTGANVKVRYKKRRR